MRTHIGFSTAAIFRALAAGNEFGLDIMRHTGLPSGTVYPTLTRAEAAGLVRSRWERNADALKEGRPKRRYYALTASGHRALDAALERFRELAEPHAARRRS
jgi:PadR family transcriptional regulator, regulatory protein PadR